MPKTEDKIVTVIIQVKQGIRSSRPVNISTNRNTGKSKNKDKKKDKRKKTGKDRNYRRKRKILCFITAHKLSIIGIISILL